MKLLTADGRYADTTTKAGLYYDAHSLPPAIGGGHVELAALPGGIVQYATFSAIYRHNPWVNAVVTKIARSLATLPLHVYAVDGAGDRERVRPAAAGRGALPRLLREPQPRNSGVRMRMAWITDALVHGTGLMVIRRDPASAVITGLEHILWRDVVPDLTLDGRQVLSWRIRRGPGLWDTFAPEDVVALDLAPDTDGPLGLSPLEPLARDLGIMDAVARQLFAFFKNQARPSGVLTMEGARPDVIADAREQVDKMYASPENAGKVLVTSGRFGAMTATPDQAKVIEVLRITREAACAVYDVPPPVIGDLSQGVKSNVQEMREQFYRDSIGPRAVEVEAALACQLLPSALAWQELFVEHEMRGVLRPTPKEEAEALSMSHEMTIDEKRAVRNLPALRMPGFSDVPMVPAGVLPLGQQTADNLGRDGVPDAGSSDDGPSDA